jgi:hypothetical protein
LPDELLFADQALATEWLTAEPLLSEVVHHAGVDRTCGARGSMAAACSPCCALLAAPPRRCRLRRWRFSRGSRFCRGGRATIVGRLFFGLALTAIIGRVMRLALRRIRLAEMIRRDRQSFMRMIFSTERSLPFSEGSTSVIAVPSAPLRPVRPMRCT